MTQKVMLSRVIDRLPFELKTLYNGRCTGRFSWLSRFDPEGRRGRELWLDVAAANAWLTARGYNKIDQGGGTKN